MEDWVTNIEILRNSAFVQFFIFTSGKQILRYPVNFYAKKVENTGNKKEEINRKKTLNSINTKKIM